MPAVPVPGLQAPPSNPPSGMPQVVEALLGDSSLPEKLADIINRCVTSRWVMEGPDSISGTTITFSLLAVMGKSLERSCPHRHWRPSLTSHVPSQRLRVCLAQSLVSVTC